MGVSFKVARIGTRYKHKPLQIDDDGYEVEAQSNQLFEEGRFKSTVRKVFGISDALAKPRRHLDSDDVEVSFYVNLFQNEFSLGEVSEPLNRAPEQLFPYNKDSMTLFSAIEYGCLPGVLLDDLPFKYVNGSVLCEIRDYRSCPRSSRIVHRVALRMTMENIVNDILSISDDSWTYKDLLEFESRVLKALQPVLDMNPQPLQKKVDLNIQWSWKKRAQPNDPVTNQPIDTVATPVRNRKSNTLQGSHSESRVLASKPSRNSIEVKDLCASVEPNNPVSVTAVAAKQNTRKRTRNQTKKMSPNKNDAKVKRPKRATPRSSKKAKNEPIEWSTEKTTVPEEQTRLEKPHSQNENLDFFLNSLAGLNSRAVKLEPSGSCHLLHAIVNPSSIVSSQNQKPSHPSLRTGDNHRPNVARKKKSPEICGQSSPSNPNPRNVSTTLEVKAPTNPSPRNVSTTLPVKALAHPRQDLQGLSVVDRKKSAGMMADLSTRLVKQSPGFSEEAVIARLRKVIDVTQRNRVIKKRKPDHCLRNQLLFHQPSDVALHLLNWEFNDKFDDALSGRISSLSEIPVGDINFKRIIFVHKRVFLNQEEDKERRVRLVLEQTPNNDAVKANILYEYQEGFDSTVLPNSHSAELFASQFTSLMAREGYHLSSDEIKPICSPSHEMLSTRKLELCSPASGLADGSFSAAQSHVNIGAEFGALSRQVQEITIRRAQLRHGLQQRVRNRELLSQRTAMMGGPPGFDYYHNPSVSESTPSIADISGMSNYFGHRWRQTEERQWPLRSWIGRGDSVGLDYDPCRSFVWGPQ